MTIGGNATTNFQTSTMQRRPPAVNNNITTSSPATIIKDTVEVIPSSNTVDSAMYERDQQIYKCSTMRSGSKFSDGTLRKPSILNCPLPEIPKQEDEVIVAVKRPEEIYVSRFLRNPKTLPGLKAIPPPRIKSPEPKPTEQISIITTSTTLTTDTKPIVSTPVTTTATTTTPTTINPNDDSNYAVTEL